MKRTLNCTLLTLVLALALPALAQALTFDDLRPDIPPCKQTKAKRPRLPADRELSYLDVLRYDFNGDGWCDYAIAVPYPANSQMNSYSIDEMMLLGSKTKWMPVLHGRKWWRIDKHEYPAEEYPMFQVDLTGAHLIYPKAGGAPYVLRLFAGWPGDRYKNVYRWDDAVGTFRRVDPATAQVVLDYFEQRIPKPCQKLRPCEHPECANRCPAPLPAKGK